MELTKWHMEMDLFKSFKTGFIVEGNIYDLHPYPFKSENGMKWNMLKLDKYLFEYLRSNGYESIAYYNNIDGFYNKFCSDSLEQMMKITNNKSTSKTNHSDKEIFYKATLDKATEMIRDFLGDRQGPKAVIMNLASRYISSPDNLNDEERQFYSKLLLSTLNQVQVKTENGFVNNLLFIVANKINDIPTWFYIDNPHIKTLNVLKPDKTARKNFIDTQLRFFVDVDKFSHKDIDKYKEQFVNLTEGFKNIELNGLKILCKQQNIPINKIEDAVTLFKYGIKKNPWNNIGEEKLSNIEAEIKKRVKGQENCIVQTIDIIKRAISGMSGLQHSSSSSKPKGILFFAGPTGTGKTELAKTLAAWLFGTENACIRFDMSEYQQSHSDQKLLGAPPGYVGYEAGGQLTNAIKEKPFSILLFDEIEKAHPSILDKFLQILEDGRMTDGKGETVYFSDSIIIFTSNLGIYTKDHNGNRVVNVTPDMDYSNMQEKIMKAIKDYFTLDLGRPEILNRIGNNFVIFDYIREEVAELIMNSQLSKIMDSLKENKEITLDIEENAIHFLLDKVLNNLENGGRGIGNIIEKYFINPLSRYVIDNGIKNNSQIIVKNIKDINDIVDLECEANNV